MRLSKDIFDVTEDNVKFLRYLRKNPKSFISDICEEFHLGKNNLSTRLNQWEEQEYILKERITPKLGGKRYHYSLSDKAIEKLETLKVLASELGG